MYDITDDMMEVLKNKNLLEIYSCLDKDMLRSSFWQEFKVELARKTIKVEKNNYNIECNLNFNKFSLVLNNRKIMIDISGVNNSYLLLSDALKNPRLETHDEHINITHNQFIEFHLRIGSLYTRVVVLSHDEIKTLQQLVKNPELVNFI